VHEPGVAAMLALGDLEPRRDQFSQLGDMRYEPDQPAAFQQLAQRLESEFEGFGVERIEPLVDEKSPLLCRSIASFTAPATGESICISSSRASFPSFA